MIFPKSLSRLGVLEGVPGVGPDILCESMVSGHRTRGEVGQES